jgi:hypothetical protein
MIERVAPLLLLWSVVLTAQTRTATKVIVSLEGCDSTHTASLVLNGDDLGAFPLALNGGRWTFEREESFDASKAIASLRLHPGRTTCRPALPDREDESGNPVAVFVFRCTPGEFRRIGLDFGGSLPFAYRRDVARAMAREDVPCSERGTFLASKGSVDDVDADREKIFLYPAYREGDFSQPGIRISDDATTPGVRTLSRHDLGALFLRQAGAGDANAAPRLSANWQKRVEADLANRRIDKLVITVQP